MQNRIIILADGRQVTCPPKPTEGPKLARSIFPAQPPFNSWMEGIHKREFGAANWPVKTVHYLNISGN